MPGTSAGTFARRQRSGRIRDLAVIRLDRGILARKHHVHLQERARSVHAVVVELRVQRLQRAGRRRLARVDVMVAVHQDLGLHDRHDAALLAQRRVPRHRVHVREEGEVRGEPVADEDGGAPLGEPGPEIAVLAQPFAQPVEALRHGLAGEQGQRLRPRVDLDARG